MKTNELLIELRKEQALPDESYDFLVNLPVVEKDEFRRSITVNDIPLIKKLLKMKYKNAIVLGHIMCRNLLNLPEIKRLLQKLWDNAADKDVKIAIMYDLAEYKDISEKTLNDFLEFIKSNREIYVRHIVDWYDGQSKIIEQVFKRIQNPALEHKRWIYIINLSVSSEKNEATKLISSYLNDENSFVRLVAEYSLESIKKEKQA